MRSLTDTSRFLYAIAIVGVFTLPIAHALAGTYPAPCCVTPVGDSTILPDGGVLRYKWSTQYDLITAEKYKDEISALCGLGMAQEPPRDQLIACLNTNTHGLRFYYEPPH